MQPNQEYTQQTYSHLILTERGRFLKAFLLNSGAGQGYPCSLLLFYKVFGALARGMKQQEKKEIQRGKM